MYLQVLSEEDEDTPVAILKSGKLFGEVKQNSYRSYALFQGGDHKPTRDKT